MNTADLLGRGQTDTALVAKLFLYSDTIRKILCNFHKKIVSLYFRHKSTGFIHHTYSIPNQTCQIDTITATHLPSTASIHFYVLLQI